MTTSVKFYRQEGFLEKCNLPKPIPEKQLEENLNRATEGTDPAVTNLPNYKN